LDTLHEKYSFEHRRILLTGKVNDAMFARFDLLCELFLDDINTPVDLVIHSHGGEPYAAIAIVNRMRSCGLQFNVSVYGHCASAAVLILAAGHRRTLYHGCVIMHHEATYDVGAQKHSEHISQLKQAQREEETWAKFMERFTGKPAQFWLKAGRKTDLFLTPEEAIQLNLADVLRSENE
jgi:ATP-dependent protease ClpP protease subunit